MQIGPIRKSGLVVSVAVLLGLALGTATAAGGGGRTAARAVSQRKLYLADAGTGNVHVFRARFRTTVAVSFLRTIGGFNDLAGIAVEEDNGALALVTQTDGTLKQINTKKDRVTASYDIGTDLRGVIITPDGKHALIADHRRKKVLVFDIAAEQVIGEVKVKQRPLDLFQDQTGAWAVLTHLKKNFVTVLDVAETIASVSSSAESGSANLLGPSLVVRLRNLPKTAYSLGIVSNNARDGSAKAWTMYAPDTTGDGQITQVTLTNASAPGTRAAMKPEKTTLKTGWKGAVWDVWPHPSASNLSNKCVTRAFTGLADGDMALWDKSGTLVLAENVQGLARNMWVTETTLAVGNPLIQTFPNGCAIGFDHLDSYGLVELPGPPDPAHDVYYAGWDDPAADNRDCTC